MKKAIIRMNLDVVFLPAPYQPFKFEDYYRHTMLKGTILHAFNGKITAK